MPFNLTITKALKVDESVDAAPARKGYRLWAQERAIDRSRIESCKRFQSILI